MHVFEPSLCGILMIVNALFETPEELNGLLPSQESNEDFYFQKKAGHAKLAKKSLCSI